ncbi:SIMPL domain-containing protein [Actinomadura parmotrematis]|uniref:SIMPL domain-containing protein n=1 Tax=Actinomadura parmotrematis TaxID=2864039 RepID=A0ABS7FKD5_9ACTN|nr:SIMPL domain-containing protein [Actinomadura parmotrematis]MBW8480832.1 SIMPL domain-containing protein [Actinomadura parmotrematis]
MSTTMITRAAAAAAAALCLAAAPAPAAGAAAREDRIEVAGQGRVPVRPDVLYVRTGVEVRGAAPADAYRRAARAAAALVRVLTASGVAGADVRTAELSVEPEYDPDRAGKVVGYRGSEAVDATVRDLPHADRTLSAVLDAGPDVRLHGATFDKEDTRAEQAEAERLAIEDARDRAARAAEHAGRALGRVLSMRLSTVDAIPAHLYAKDSIAAAGGHLSPGEGVQRVTATVVYALA